MANISVSTADRQNEATTLPYIRSIQHKDWRGDPITDPDTSNPTRPRLERPLDTIRSFEAAIDGEWKRKSHNNRSGKDRDLVTIVIWSLQTVTESEDFTQYSSRRASYVGGKIARILASLTLLETTCWLT